MSRRRPDTAIEAERYKLGADRARRDHDGGLSVKDMWRGCYDLSDANGMDFSHGYQTVLCAIELAAMDEAEVAS